MQDHLPPRLVELLSVCTPQWLCSTQQHILLLQVTVPLFLSIKSLGDLISEENFQSAFPSLLMHSPSPVDSFLFQTVHMPGSN